MIKTYSKITTEILDENMNPTGKTAETLITHLKAETGKKILQKSTGIMGTGVDIGDGDSVDNYEEVDDPNYVEVIQAIEDEVSGNV